MTVIFEAGVAVVLSFLLKLSPIDGQQGKNQNKS